MQKCKIIAAIGMLLAIMLSGCKDNTVTPVSGEIKGTITSKTMDGTVSGYPQLKVYLLNASIKPDTVNIANNKNLFLDSTVTDDNGSYSFRLLKEGNYALFPYTGNPDIIVNKEQGSPDPTDITINSREQSYNINFQATYPYEGTTGDISAYELNVVFKNLQTGSHYTMYIHRFEYYCFIPVLMKEYRMEMGEDPVFRRGFTYNKPYGYTTLLYTMTNKYRFTFTKLAGTTETFDYDLTLSSCPQSVIFEYDWEAKTLTRKL